MLSSSVLASVAATTSVAAITAVVIHLVRSFLTLRRRYPFEHHTLPVEPPLVSILVPARNEALNIESCLESLLNQDYPNFEILVLDDASNDDTLARSQRVAATDARVRVSAGSGPPPGWIGKCHALTQLVDQANGDWFLFVDADTTHSPDSLSAGLAYARHHRLDALSCAGTRVARSFWERVWEPIWPMVLFGWLDPIELNKPITRVRFAIGQWLLIATSTYQSVGGHTSVRTEIVEDCALFGRLRAAGHATRVLLSTPLYRVRMYRSLREIIDGWSKNAYRAMRFIGVGRFGLVATALIIVAVTLLPFALSAATLTGVVTGPAWLMHSPAVLAVLVAFGIRVEQRQSPLLAWTLPLAGILITFVLVNSMLRTRLGLELRWKDRAYPGGSPRR